jgi:GMP synthase (glutamine-hydrolysing)
VKPLVSIENEGLAHLGVAEETFQDQGLEVEHVRAWKGDEPPPLDRVGAVVSLGGEMNVDQDDIYPYLASERTYLAEAVDRDIPVLGICLGGQLLARALGAEVVQASQPELGFVPLRLTPEGHRDPVLSALADGDRMFQWHVDSFELPLGSVLLATGDHGGNQVFRAGRRAWGVQFHPEVTAEELDQWLELVEGVEQTYGRSKASIQEEIRRELPAQQERARALFRRFADVARG